MLDRIFAPVLTFVTLIAATVGFGSALLYTPPAETLVAQAMPPELVVLERVEIVARRAPTKPAPAATRAATEGRGVWLHTPKE